MTDTLALEALYNAVVTRFAEELPAVEHTFGWREPNRQQGGTSRVVWRPGDEAGGVGEVGPARNPGRNPRPLATLHEAVTLYIQGCDLTAPDNELAQWKATRLLFDAVVRAIYLAAHGTYEIKSVNWAERYNERRFGATIILNLAVESMIPDSAQMPAPVDTSAVIGDSIDDLTETVTAP